MNINLIDILVGISGLTLAVFMLLQAKRYFEQRQTIEYIRRRFNKIILPMWELKQRNKLTLRLINEIDKRYHYLMPKHLENLISEVNKRHRVDAEFHDKLDNFYLHDATLLHYPIHQGQLQNADLNKHYSKRKHEGNVGGKGLVCFVVVVVAHTILKIEIFEGTCGGYIWLITTCGIALITILSYFRYNKEDEDISIYQ
jgi:hypothetical protein